MPFFRRVLVLAVCCVVCCSFVLAYDTPSVFSVQGSVFVSVSGSRLGAVDIMLSPSQVSGYLTLDESGVPFNISSSTVTGYVFDSSGEAVYTVRWPAWSYAEYRQSDGGYQYENLDITGVSSSNVQWVSYSDFQGPSDSSWRYIFLGLVLLGVFVCFIKR